ncbi:MAG: hypothetical protein DLM57_05050 [Pseudonocardiales bacterium]|nr:MAG: hypothetical protein DLM57_05050 [Pseudonocardiales bacterium]
MLTWSRSLPTTCKIVPDPLDAGKDLAFRQRQPRSSVRRVDRVLTVLGTWTFDPFLGFGLIACAGAYLWALRTLKRRGQSPPWPRRYTSCFFSGLALTWFVLLGPIGAYDDIFFWAHMTQHLTIMMVAAPLLVLGAPVLLLLRVSSRGFRRRHVVPVLRSRAVAALTHPVVSWMLFAGVLVGTHFSPFYEFALEHQPVHKYVEHSLYLGAALAYYYPLLSPTPAPNRLPYGLRAVSLSLMMVPEAMSGFFIYASSYLRYPYYGTVSRPFGPAPLRDQQFGGALMWAGSMIVDSIWVAMAVHEWLRSEERLARQIDLETLARATLPASRPE